MSVASSPSQGSLENNYLERLRDEYGLPALQPELPLGPNSTQSDHATSIIDQDGQSHMLENGEEEAYEFRLFSGPSATGVAVNDHDAHRVAIRSPSPANKDPGFVVLRRGVGYYFTGEINALREEELLAAAVSGEEVLSGLDVKWPGCALPWRVSVVTSSPTNQKISLKANNDQRLGHPTSKGRKRSGKKRRIAIRMKIQAAERNRQEKDKASKEKKTRLNRGKKVRRKMKEKAAKMEKAAEA